MTVEERKEDPMTDERKAFERVQAMGGPLTVSGMWAQTLNAMSLQIDRYYVGWHDAEDAPGLSDYQRRVMREGYGRMCELWDEMRLRFRKRHWRKLEAACHQYDAVHDWYTGLLGFVHPKWVAKAFEGREGEAPEGPPVPSMPSGW